jgi:hypothetical protein
MGKLIAMQVADVPNGGHGRVLEAIAILKNGLAVSSDEEGMTKEQCRRELNNLSISLRTRVVKGELPKFRTRTWSTGSGKKGEATSWHWAIIPSAQGE